MKELFKKLSLPIEQRLEAYQFALGQIFHEEIFGDHHEGVCVSLIKYLIDLFPEEDLLEEKSGDELNNIVSYVFPEWWVQKPQNFKGGHWWNTSTKNPNSINRRIALEQTIAYTKSKIQS